MFETIKPELFAILTTEPAFSTGVYRDEWASCLKGEKKIFENSPRKGDNFILEGKSVGHVCVCSACVWGCWDHRGQGTQGAAGGGFRW